MVSGCSLFLSFSVRREDDKWQDQGLNCRDKVVGYIVVQAHTPTTPLASRRGDAAAGA